MEGVLRRSSGRGGVVKEETRDQYTGEEAVVVKTGNKRPYHGNEDMKPSSPNKKDSSCNKQALRTHLERSSMEPDSIESSSSRKEQENRLVSARAEMGEVREENQRLKMHLNRIMKDYQILQLQFHDIIQKESNISTDTSNNKDQETEEPELVSLSLGRFSGYSKKNEKNKIPSEQYNIEHKNSEEGLNLGLECKFEAFKSDDNEPMTNARSRNSFEESKEEAKETLPPSKVLKTVRSGDDEISLLNNPAKKTRVSVRARCDTPTMNDGCQWRKYGQKIAKGNPCPRAYYRCTVAPSCPVRKQVQRCADDLSILITTYEGTHNHLLPMSATAMASTTSAAASMLLSGSSSSSRPGSGPLATISTSDNLHGLNLYLTDNTRSRQFYLPNASQSPSSFPTITLDLTSTPSSLSSNFDRFSSTYPLSYDPTSLNFGSSESNSMSWGNGFLGYGSHQPHIKNQIGTLNVGRTEPVENIYQSYMQKNPTTPPQQSLPANAIAAATKAITADPSFQSALAAALTSIIGNGSSGNGANQSGGPGGENLGQKLKRGETFQVASNYSTTTKGNGCASSYLNSSSTTSSRPVSSMFLPSSLPFSTSKSASTSAGDSREHTN